MIKAEVEGLEYYGERWAVVRNGVKETWGSSA